MKTLIALPLVLAPLCMGQGSMTPSRRGSIPPDPVEASASTLELAATGLREAVSQFAEDHDQLLSNQWLRQGNRHFSLAEQSVKKLLHEGAPSPSDVCNFHLGLEVYLMALEELPGYKPGMKGWEDVVATPKPSSKEIRSAEKDLEKIIELANGTPGLQSIQVIPLSKDSSPNEVQVYASCAMQKIRYFLDNKLLERISGGGQHQKGEIVDPALAVADEAVAALVPFTSADWSKKGTADEYDAAIDDLQSALTELDASMKALVRALHYASRRVERASAVLDPLAAGLKKVKAPKNR